MNSIESKRGGRPGNRRSGFSLVELLVTLALTSVVLAAVYAAMDSQARSHDATEQWADLNQNLRVGVESVVRDVRVAGMRTDKLGQPAFAQAGPFQLAIYADVNGSCTCGGNDIRIAEDVCWGDRTSADALAPTPVPAPPSTCPSLDGTSEPYGDSPNGINFYSDGVIPADPTNAPSHAELILWTYDGTDPDNDANPLVDDAFTAADEALLAVDGGSGACPAAGINEGDVDDSLAVAGNSLMNLSRIVVTNDTNVNATGNDQARSLVSRGLIGPCDAAGVIRQPTDEIGNPWPAFAYWIDLTEDKTITTDCDGSLETGEDILWGDTNFDCVFSSAEFVALTAVPRVNAARPRANLDNILRVDVHLVAQSAQRARAGVTVGNQAVDFRQRHLTSSAFVRTER